MESQKIDMKKNRRTCFVYMLICLFLVLVISFVSEHVSGFILWVYYGLIFVVIVSLVISICKRIR